MAPTPAPDPPHGAAPWEAVRPVVVHPHATFACPTPHLVRRHHHVRSVALGLLVLTAPVVGVLAQQRHDEADARRTATTVAATRGTSLPAGSPTGGVLAPTAAAMTMQTPPALAGAAVPARAGARRSAAAPVAEAASTTSRPVVRGGGGVPASTPQRTASVAPATTAAPVSTAPAVAAAAAAAPTVATAPAAVATAPVVAAPAAQATPTFEPAATYTFTSPTSGHTWTSPGSEGQQIVDAVPGVTYAAT